MARRERTDQPAEVARSGATGLPAEPRHGTQTVAGASDNGYVDLLPAFRRELARLAPGVGSWLLALSGGADSVAALLLLLDAAKERAPGDDWRVAAAHLDHRLRPGSRADAEFVADLCHELGVPLTTAAVDVGAVAADRRWNLEEAARRVRYRFLYDAARDQGAGAIVVAHTRDDQAETFLRQALRGSAFPAGMPAKRGLVVRPLLGVGRAALREYLRAQGRDWREDPSNLDVQTQERAWLRHAVLPLLQSRYPHAPAHLARTAGGLADARDTVDQLAQRLFGTTSLSVTALANAPAALQRAALAGLLREAGVEPRFELLEEARAVVSRGAGLADPASAAPWRLSVAWDKVLRVAYGRVEVVTPATADARLPLPVANHAAYAAGLEASGGAPQDALGETAVTGLLLDHGELTLRHRRPGDRIRLPGGSKLVSDLLIDLKVPREERGALRLLAAGREVFWIEGVATAHGLGARSTVESPSDRHWMQLALTWARRAADAGELPVGAVVARDGAVLAAAHNTSRAGRDATAHAEMLALREAGRSDGDKRLAGATLYVTLEPCPMCFGAVLQTHIPRVVYGAANVREGALGSVVDLRSGPWKRVPTVEGGLLAKQSARLLKEFFAALR